MIRSVLHLRLTTAAQRVNSLNWRMTVIFKTYKVRVPNMGGEDFWNAHERLLKKNKERADRLYRYAIQWDKAFARLQKWEAYLPEGEYFDLNRLQIRKIKAHKKKRK